MSGTSTRAKNSLYKSVLPSEMEKDTQFSTLAFGLSYPSCLSHEKLPGPLPPLPHWMLDTPMYSKLPMVPAPKGKIVLFTTGLCEKLHQTPDDLDFDPVAAGMCCEYKSLHDPHLKSHYTRQVTYDRLIRSGYITPDGMVKCSLKEFNDYHQYLKSVRLEKITQDRKRMLREERERLSQELKHSIQKDVSVRDRLIKESLIKQKKVRDRERKKLSRKLQSDYRKTMIRLVEQRHTKMVLQQNRRKASEEKHHAIRTYLETEDKLKKALIKAKRTAEEMRRADLMKLKRKKEKEERERKLEDQWNRREEARTERMLRERAALAKQREEMFQKIERREEKVARHREKQRDMFLQIREERHEKVLNKELAIATQLEKKIHALCRKYSAGPKRGRRRFPLISPKMTTDMTTWGIPDKQWPHKLGSSSDGGSTDKLPPIVSSDESGSIYDTSSLPSVKSSVLSTGDAPVSLPEVLDSFTVIARQLASSVFSKLKADPEFENVDWEDAERPVSPDIYVEASEVSPQASLMVSNALKTALNQLDESQPTLVKVTTLEDKAKAVVSRVIESSLKSLLPFSHIELVENKSASKEADDSCQRSYKVDERLAGGSEDTAMLSSIIEMFQPAEDVPSITHTAASSEESESEADEEEGDAVIGIVENTILMDEMEHAGGPSGDMDIDEGLHVVMHRAQDGHLVVDGAVLTAEHDKQTLTERILSDITLERVSGSLSGASSTRNGLAREEAAPSSSSEEEGEEIVPEDHSSIVPIYQKHLINLGGDLVKSHLSAISMKPEADGSIPSRGKCAARNSFRNIFRPDMTYCQGSARMLRETLVKDIKGHQTASLSSGMEAVYEVLEQEEQDIMEKHSDEALVTMEETEGLCYLPPRKKKPVASEVPPAAGAVQAETGPGDTPLSDDGEETNITSSNVHQDGSVHRGGSVHFTATTIDPPVKKQSIYESHHRPQTPIPHMHIDVDDDEEEEEEIVISGVDGEEDVPIGVVEEDAASESHDKSSTAEGLTNPENPQAPQLQEKNDSNNAQTECASRSAALLSAIQTSQLQPPLVPSARTSNVSQSQDGPTPCGSQASQGSQRLMPPRVRSPSDRSLSSAQSMTITGRSITPIDSKVVKSVTSTEEKRGSLEEVSPRSPSSGRGCRVGLSHLRRVRSPQKRGWSSSQSASKIKIAYGSAAGLSISGCQILPNKPPHSASSYTRRSSGTQAGLISATELGFTQGSCHKTGSRRSVTIPRPPSGTKPAGSAQSGHRVVRHASRAQAMSNPTITTDKGSSATLFYNHSSKERLLKRRASLEKENWMERLSTESVSSRRSSKEKVAKKKSSGTQPEGEESLQEQKPGAPMPPIKASLTPLPPNQPRQRSRPYSAVKKAMEEDPGQKMLGVDQVLSEE